MNFSVRAHQGLLIMMRFHELDGPFCRSCGRSVVRQIESRWTWNCRYCDGRWHM
ncbi:hypothetical protein [Streptomyces sp. C10]|uniref:hypothetical protein n=1 Tax=Streptomyces sp. C10 TaxID=531941 RepID=UPI003980DF6B